MNKKYFIGVFAFLAMLALIYNVSASCIMPGSVEEEFARADAVFEGTVSGFRAEGELNNYVSFRVAKFWKGEDRFAVLESYPPVLTVLVPSADRVSVGYDYEIDKNYIVYAYDSDGDGQLETNLCTRANLNVEDIERERELLNADSSNERMLNQFNDRKSFVPGKILVSFKESVEKSQAENILEKYGLSIQKMTVCDETKRDGTYEERGCQEIDRWDEGLKVAHVEVPNEEEKKYAEILIDEELVVWIEPAFAVEVAGDSEGLDDGEAGCTKELKICNDGSGVGRNPELNCEFDACPQNDSAETGLFSRFVSWLKGVFS